MTTAPNEVPSQVLQKKPQAHSDERLKCGQCKWFYVGYEGVTCLKTRGVQPPDRACIEFENYKPSVFDPLLKDKYVRGIAKQTVAYSDASLLKILTEVKNYRLFRAELKEQSTFDYASEEKLVNIAKTFEKISSYQEKILDYQDDLTASLNKLQASMKEVQAYLLSHYQELFKNMKNDTERQAMLRLAIPELYRAIESTEGARDRLNSTYAYLKDVHFSTTATQSSAHKVWEYRQMFMGGRKHQNG